MWKLKNTEILKAINKVQVVPVKWIELNPRFTYKNQDKNRMDTERFTDLGKLDFPDVGSVLSLS